MVDGSTNIDKPGNIRGLIWGSIVMEASGSTTETLTPHLDNGARKVLDLQHRSKRACPTSSSATTPTMYPPSTTSPQHRARRIRSLGGEGGAWTFGIERGVITTIHDVTNTRVIVDAQGPRRAGRRSTR